MMLIRYNMQLKEYRQNALEQLDRWLDALKESLTSSEKAGKKDGFFFETKDRLFYLIYEPILAFLRSTDSALNSDRAERIAKQAKAKKKTAVVFATHKFMGQKELSAMGIVFCGLQYYINSDHTMIG